MTEKPTRRRRRMLLVPLLGIGVAAWAVRSRLAERGTLHDGWQPLPPRRVTPGQAVAAAPAPAVEPVESTQPRAAAAPVAQVEIVEPEPDAEVTPDTEVTPEPEPVSARARAVPAATAVASVAAPALPDPPAGSVRALDDGTSPEAEYVVKGKTATRVFYAPGSPYYARTRADVWFRTAADASAAGFTPRAPRRSG
jgi:hypothetical protein